jgi:hypothetical protein
MKVGLTAAVRQAALSDKLGFYGQRREQVIDRRPVCALR